MKDIIRFYSEHPDDERLFEGWGMLELARSKEIVLRHLAPGVRTVLDVGGWHGHLYRMACRTRIRGAPDRHHAELARANRVRIASAKVGDARNLAWPDASVDVVLLLGPLYHLIEKADRALALPEARRNRTRAGRRTVLVSKGSQTGFAECWANPVRRDRLLELARKIEHDPMALALSPHLLAVGRV
jgi:hypothetical protein